MKNSDLRTAGTSRITRGARLAALVLLTSGFWISSSSAAPVASVVALEPTRVADLVLLQGGFDAGLRQGMVCRVTRGALEIAEILLVELRPTCSAALILNIAAKQSIHPGDVARIKVLKT
jgi:hypothetical protein